ncbi:MAG: thiamine biosynthesis protein ThiS [Bacteroidetes bacterium]|nr:MAG: thiamine biosynthesis protein ThiS [Bacteroidota bacterium]
MEITLNNRNENFDCETMTVSQLLEIKNFTFKMIVIKINGKLIKKDVYETTLIKNNDNVNVIHLISGG